MEDAQASFHILRLFATSRLSHLLRTVPPSITCKDAANYEALVEWALASIIAGDGAAAAGSQMPEEVAHDPTCAQIRHTWDTRPYDRPTCQSEKAALDLPAAAPSKARPISAATPWSRGVVTASARGNLPSLLARLPERPMASALTHEVKTVATEAKRSQMGDAMGSSWAALAAEEDPQGRGTGTLLVKAEAEGWGGGGERGGLGGGGVEQREQREDLLTTQPNREIELSQTN